MVRPSARRDADRNDVSKRYKGVRMRKWGRWVAEVRQPNSRDRIWLGSYGKPEEAARAYDAAVFCLRGPSATLNFPSTPPDIPHAADLSPSEIQVAASKHARKAPEECCEGPELNTTVPPVQAAAGEILTIDYAHGQTATVILHREAAIATRQKMTALLRAPPVHRVPRV